MCGGMKKLFVSLVTLAAVGALGFGATRAFFSDTETSTGNTFQAGGLDLKVDSECHYFQNNEAIGCDGFGTWGEADLVPGIHKFFNFTDIKPGDYGEDTLSLHVVGNDAWGRLVIGDFQDSDNTCPEPEEEAEGEPCGTEGELGENLLVSVWLDQGISVGFGGKPSPQGGDAGEGDNIRQTQEPFLIAETTLDQLPSTIDLTQELADYRQSISATCDFYDPDGDGQTGGPGYCQGLATDGRLVGSVTYYFAIAWELPASVGNEVQTDSVGFDLAFEVEQTRNNPTPFEI